MTAIASKSWRTQTIETYVEALRETLLAVEELALVACEKGTDFDRGEKTAIRLLAQDVGSFRAPQYSASEEAAKQAYDVACRRVVVAHRILGAPGDFGYGTRDGDALHRLYNSTNQCRGLRAAEKQAAAADQSGERDGSQTPTA